MCKWISSVCKSRGLVLQLFVFCLLLKTSQSEQCTMNFDYDFHVAPPPLFWSSSQTSVSPQTQLLNSLQSLRPQPTYHCLSFSHAERVSQGITAQWEGGEARKRKLFTIMACRLAMICVEYIDVHHLPPSFHPSFCFVLLPSLVSSCSPLLCVVLCNFMCGSLV